jgi:uncharacterized protein (TIGR00730 family)
MSDNSNSSLGDIITLDDERRASELLQQSVQGLWEVVNQLTRLRASKRNDFRVTIFGSARIPRDHWVYAGVRDLARDLAEMGCTIITGGGPGLMEAANEGAASAGTGARNIGIRVDLPFEQEVNPFVEETYEHRTFFSRLHHFVLVSDAFVVLPGGIGTVLEFTMIWQLLQIRRLKRAPLVLIGQMWREFLAWADSCLLKAEFPLVNPQDLDIPTCVSNAAEEIALIREHHAEWVHEQRIF